ncbi:MAG: InlB B-repeat-containing protein [Clostridia bacterium]|nr:InlB B-repeat-containing protein [Clostridia bacterium]
MKKRLFIKLIAVILVIVTLFSTAALTISAASDTSVTVASETKVHGNTGQRRPYTKNLEEINKKLDALTPKEKKWFKDSVKELASAKTADKAAGSIINAMFALASDSDNISKKDVALETGATLINLAASCFGFGGIAEAITGGLLSIFKDKSPSEIQLLKDHLDNQFAIVNEGIYDIRNDISDLSIDIDQSFIEAITEIETAIEAQTAGNNVRAFTSSDNGYFNYNLLKNYLYGNSTDEKNEWASYAYYDKLSRAIAEKKSDAVIEEYYNALYKSLMTSGYERDPYINIMRQYIMDDGYAIYSIQHYYYDWLSYNRDVVQKNGKDAEWEAILFTLDVYRTMLGAEHCVLACNNYFLSQIYLEYGPNPDGEASYEYVNADGSKTIIKYSDLLTDIARLNSEVREKELLDQIVQDIIYILNMENSYTLESIDGDFYTVNNVDSSTFGQVCTGQTIYMNRLSDEICEMFGLDPQKFVYKWSTGETNTGMLTVPENCEILTATLYYDGTEFYSIAFQVNNDNTFCGGNGTASDPYLISTVEQFNKIKVGEESYDNKTGSLYYAIINDIDFSNVDRLPFGNKNTPFNGVLNGDGHTLKNIRVITGEDWECVGLFAKIGSNGSVKNIILENATISGNDHAKHTIFAGGIAGQNEGTIDNCHLKNSIVKIYRYTTQKGGEVTTFAGGIAGGCYGKINNCSLNSSSVEAISERKKERLSYVYVGGIAGSLDANSTMSNVVVEGDSTLRGKTNTTSILLPFTTSAVGFFVAKNDISDHSNIKKAYVTPDTAIYDMLFNLENIGDSELFDNVNLEYGVNSRDDIVFTSSNYHSDFSYNDGNINSEYNYNENQIYTYDEDFLKTTEVYVEDGVEEKKSVLNLSVDGNDGFSLNSYKILGYYGLDTLSSDKVDGEEHLVTVVFNATLVKGSEEESDDSVALTKNVILSVDIPIVVEKIKPTELAIKTMPQTQYSEVGKEILLDRGEFEIVWEDGTKTDVTPEIVGSKTTTSLGTSNVEIAFEGLSTTYEITVECIHKYEDVTKNPTCEYEGYTKQICSKCGDEYTVDGSITNKIEHTIVIKNAVTATCNTNGTGYTGDKWCTVCNKMVEKGTVINVLQHEYEYIDGNSCKCKVCKNDKTTKPHEYTSVENDTSIIYSCATCGYSYTVEKKTITDITRVVVGNSYGLVGSDNEIVVYIKMFNNPGITGVSFRIEYDDRLEYIRYERGDLLLAASEFEVAQANGVIGFVAASPDVHGADGNLLKLVFKLPDNAQVMDSYNISIAYTRKQFTGGQANAIDIVTMDGCITAVTHLPGDVNNDGFVDVLDTALVARYVAISNTKNDELMDEFLESQNYNFSEFYADVNLDGYVDLSDLVIMLQYFVGKNVQELTSNEFEEILNSNNGSLDLESIIVKCYDKNGNRGVYPDLPTPTRPGYRFDGWYLSFDVSDLEAERIEAGDPVYYNPTYLKQTLYAHWTEIYTVKYDINAPSNASSVAGTMEDSLYEYDEKKALSKNGFNIVGWEFKGWATYANGPVVYPDGAEVVGLAHAGETVTLYAVWEANTYTIKFKNNQPTNASGALYGSMDAVECVYDTAITLDKVDYRLTGWTFMGWATSANGNVVYNDGAEIKNLTTVDGDTLTFYAVWKSNSYCVEFNANKPFGASSAITGNISNMDCSYDTTYNLPSTVYSLVGWTFKGWCRNSNGSGELYNPGTSFSNLSSVNGDKIVYYATWEPASYTVTFNANGGSGSMQPSVHIYDTAKALTDIGFTKSGYQFVGWNTKPDGSGQGYSNQAEVVNLVPQGIDSITLYAQWLPNGYIVYYDANGGTGTTPYSTHTYDAQGTLTDNGYSRIGYQFVGWNTKADGSGTNYTNKASILNLVDQGNGSITLYAQWKAHSYTIQFNSNKPSTSSGQIVGTMNNLNCTYDVNASLGNAQYSLTGWTFKGWATSANGTVVYMNNATINNLTSVDGQIITLYAVWEANEYIIAFNANKLSNASGTVQGSMSNLNVKYDTTIKLPTNNYSLTGWTFMGWTTSSNGSVVYKDAASVSNLSSVDGNTVNLYAVWKANAYTIIYSANTGSGTMASSTHTYDTSTSLSANKYNKTGYSFVGWNTSPDGKGTYYSNSALVKNLCNGQNGSITLYAIWGINQYTISFVTGGGSAIAPLIYNYGDFTTVPSNPTRAGYDFAGWTFDDANFAFGNEMPTHNIVATANWTYKSTYYDSGYEAKKIDASYTYDYDSFDISDLAPFMQEGYKLQFSVAVYMWEEDEGYQEIYLRNSNGSNIAGNSEFAHGGSGKDGAWWEYFTFTVDGESCTNTMYLRYGAHGKSSDDWYRGRAEVTVTVIEE